MAEDTFHNEPAADFSQAADRRRMSDALASVRASFGRDYPLFINGEDLPGRPTAASAAKTAFSTWRVTDPGARGIRVSNLYLNRAITGAVVGRQPFVASVCPEEERRPVGRTTCPIS